MINNFSCDLFWFRVTADLITFSTKDMPDNVHFSISNHPNSPDVNFHVTKNIKGISPENKPQIRVISIKKDKVDGLASLFAKGMLKTMLQKINDREFNKQYKRLWFLNVGNKKNRSSLLIERQLQRIFRPIIKRTKTRIKIKKDIAKAFEDFENLQAFQDMVFNKSDLDRGLQRKINTGLMAIQDSSTRFLKINREWYKLNSPTYEEILRSIFEINVANKIIANFNDALRDIQLCSNKQDCKKYNKPLELIVVKL